MDKLVSMVLSLILTIIVEVILSLPFLLLKKISWGELKEIVWVNILTNPFVTFITYLSIMYLDLKLVNLIVIALEIMVVLVEGYLFKKEFKVMKDYGFLYALYLNVLSFSFGLLF